MTKIYIHRDNKKLEFRSRGTLSSISIKNSKCTILQWSSHKLLLWIKFIWNRPKLWRMNFWSTLNKCAKVSMRRLRKTFDSQNQLRPICDYDIYLPTRSSRTTYSQSNWAAWKTLDRSWRVCQHGGKLWKPRRSERTQQRVWSYPQQETYYRLHSKKNQ